MRFLVISSAPTLFEQNRYFAYSPYARELNIWSHFVTDFEILSPTVYHKKLILEEDTFLKRPVFIIKDQIFIGNTKKVIEAVQLKLHEG